MIRYLVVKPPELVSATKLQTWLDEKGEEDWCLVHVGVLWIFLRVTK